MSNPVRGYYWHIRKQGVGKKTAITKTAKKFGLLAKKGGRRGDYWIQKAIKKKGALRATVQRRYGSSGFVKKGRRKVIKQDVLRELAKEPGTTGRRARLALTLKKLK